MAVDAVLEIEFHRGETRRLDLRQHMVIGQDQLRGNHESGTEAAALETVTDVDPAHAARDGRAQVKEGDAQQVVAFNDPLQHMTVPGRPGDPDQIARGHGRQRLTHHGGTRNPLDAQRHPFRDIHIQDAPSRLMGGLDPVLRVLSGTLPGIEPRFRGGHHVFRQKHHFRSSAFTFRAPESPSAWLRTPPSRPGSWTPSGRAPSAEDTHRSLLRVIAALSPGGSRTGPSGSSNPGLTWLRVAADPLGRNHCQRTQHPRRRRRHQRAEGGSGAATPGRLESPRTCAAITYSITARSRTTASRTGTGICRVRNTRMSSWTRLTAATVREPASPARLNPAGGCG